MDVVIRGALEKVQESGARKASTMFLRPSCIDRMLKRKRRIQLRRYGEDDDRTCQNLSRRRAL
jgi:hypothetical protein